MCAYQLEWTDFYTNFDLNLKVLFKEKRFDDATLVSDDQVYFKAHKLILSVSSPVIKDLLMKNPHPNPTIYLRGIHSTELESIIHYVYSGEIRTSQKKRKKILDIAEDLQMKQLNETLVRNCENIVADVKCEVIEDVADIEDKSFSSKSFLSSSEIKVENKDTCNDFKCSNCESTFKRKKYLTRHVRSVHEGSEVLDCPKCESIFKHKHNLSRHIKEKHEGVTYSCDSCSYKATHMSSLKRHQAAIHEGVRHACDTCSFATTQPGNLRRHQDVMHRDARYTEDCCLDAEKRGDIKSHREFIHGDVRYPCDQCDYKASKRSNLVSHKRSKHDGVRYFCDSCDYSATRLGYMKAHIESVHKGIAKESQ